MIERFVNVKPRFSFRAWWLGFELRIGRLGWGLYGR
jgi:hypothetical protein